MRGNYIMKAKTSTPVRFDARSLPSIAVMFHGNVKAGRRVKTISGSRNPK